MFRREVLIAFAAFAAGCQVTMGGPTPPEMSKSRPSARDGSAVREVEPRLHVKDDPLIDGTKSMPSVPAEAFAQRKPGGSFRAHEDATWSRHTITVKGAVELPLSVPAASVVLLKVLWKGEPDALRVAVAQAGRESVAGRPWSSEPGKSSLSARFPDVSGSFVLRFVASGSPVETEVVTGVVPNSLKP